MITALRETIQFQGDNPQFPGPFIDFHTGSMKVSPYIHRNLQLIRRKKFLTQPS